MTPIRPQPPLVRTPSELGVKIRAYRERHGLTQKEFGERAGVGGAYPHVTISDLETGYVQRPHPRSLSKIRQVLEADGPINDATQSAEEAAPSAERLAELVREINALGFAVTLTPVK
jgi:transcriptional regulator with XRE-family HTH domain